MVLEGVVIAGADLDDAVAGAVGYLARQGVLVAVDTCMTNISPGRNPECRYNRPLAFFFVCGWIF